MQFTRSDHIADLAQLQASRRAATRAIADNFAFDENVGPDRIGHFALMQYTVEEVFREATVAQPFAVPTVLESRNSAFVFPAPAGQGVGYAVDLDPRAGRDWIREFLHIRLTWRADHLARVARLTGPTPAVGLAAVRDAHLGPVRTKCARPDYGAPMSGEVDA